MYSLVKINIKNPSILTRIERSAPGSYRLFLWHSLPQCTFLSWREQGALQSHTTYPDTVGDRSLVLCSSGNCTYCVHIFIYVCYLLKVEVGLYLWSRTGTPVIGLSRHQREQQEEEEASRHCCYGSGEKS